MAIFIIEHLEDEVYPWCVIEYKNISKIVGKDNLWFTNVKNLEKRKLSSYGRVIPFSVRDMELEDACILDPDAGEVLTPSKAGKAKYFIFGGILGDYPPKKRTKEELTKFFKKKNAFNIGKKQMSTDNAVCVVKKISEGTPIRRMKFIDKIEIKINDIESTILPYRYLIENGKPFVSNELIRYLRNS